MIWLRLRLGGQKWAAHLVGPNSKYLLNEDGSHAFGKCHYDKCIIALSKAQAYDVLCDTFLHELLHAALFVSNADAAYGKSVRTEEKIVGPVTPILHGALRDLGFKFPELPGG